MTDDKDEDDDEIFIFKRLGKGKEKRIFIPHAKINDLNHEIKKQSITPRDYNGELIDTIPLKVIELVQSIIWKFYEPPSYFVVNYIMHHPGISEEGLVSLLNLDAKHIRQILAELINDLLIEVKTYPEHGKMRFLNVHFSNFAKVVRYRLDIIRSNLDKLAVRGAAGIGYICLSCDTTYNDLDINRIYVGPNQKFKCPICEVELYEKEDESSKARTMIVNFNEEFSEILQVLGEVLMMKFSRRLLHPKPLCLKDLPNHISEIFRSTSPDEYEARINSLPKNVDNNDDALNNNSKEEEIVKNNNKRRLANRELPPWFRSSSSNVYPYTKSKDP